MIPAPSRRSAEQRQVSHGTLLCPTSSTAHQCPCLRPLRLGVGGDAAVILAQGESINGQEAWAGLGSGLRRARFT